MSLDKTKVFRPSRHQYRIESTSTTGGIDIISTPQLISACPQGQEYDLVWFRHLDGSEPKELVGKIVMYCHAGYGPMVLWGNVPEEMQVPKLIQRDAPDSGARYL